ncbi:MAG: tRNA uridine-5-carboxymethylaminomethyl(34) synthesis enzyme MnmG [Firmicutes bacterium]|nr:tRNA uridine-5-carboxymethylaminomethyl(34) synthesis enzyme MnmG [Bacillota bacterium]
MISYDTAIIGAGHAGIEAALASARLGAKTIVFSINLDSIGNCPCSPSIGGTAKGTLVREIDALGGEMGKTADACFLHSKMLNASKGPAARSIRAQIDKNKYKILMKQKIETQKNLHVYQSEVIDISQKDDYWVITTRTKIKYKVKCIVIATGTFLNGKIYIGKGSYMSGPDGVLCSEFLTNSIKKMKIPTKRFKTGTSARVLKSSINFEILEIQHGDDIVTPFSYQTEKCGKNKVPCHIAWTNDKTKEVILKNIDKSPVYNQKILGTAPRYCPSIEDKMIRFHEKERHQIFVEPCGLEDEEIYLYGMSSCLPEDIQLEFLQTIGGFENAIISKPGYAIEYDIIDPTYILHTLEIKKFKGLFSAGQINGSSGYEEAAAQGILAGINAAMCALGKEMITLSRSTSYIGTLIDDLITKGVSDPYRMLTSRSEHRLILRLDNADERLMPIGHKIGLLNDIQWKKFNARIKQKEDEKKRIKSVFIEPNEINNTILKNFGTSTISEFTSIETLLKRPEINYDFLKLVDACAPELPKEIFDRVEIETKYEGYIKRQIKQIEKLKKLEYYKIPENINYLEVKNLRLEAREKLSKIMPANLMQAKQIPGISPSDISAILVWIEKLIQR